MNLEIFTCFMLLVFKGFCLRLDCSLNEEFLPCYCSTDTNNNTELNCQNGAHFPLINNMHINVIKLFNTTVNKLATDVTCDKLILYDISRVNLESTMYINTWQYKVLEATNVETTILNEIITSKQDNLVNMTIDLNSNYWSLKEFKLLNIEYFQIKPRYENKRKVSLQAHCFMNMNFRYISLSEAIDKFQENSLQFSSKNNLEIYIGHNNITIGILKSANITNYIGSISVLSMHYNNIESVDYDIFLKLIINNPEIKIDLNGNPIFCTCNSSWTFKYENNFKNVACINHNNNNLFNLREDTLCTNVNNISLITTKNPVSTNFTDPPFITDASFSSSIPVTINNPVNPYNPGTTDATVTINTLVTTDTHTNVSVNFTYLILPYIFIFLIFAIITSIIYMIILSIIKLIISTLEKMIFSGNQLSKWYCHLDTIDENKMISHRDCEIHFYNDFEENQCIESSYKSQAIYLKNSSSEDYVSRISSEKISTNYKQWENSKQDYYKQFITTDILLKRSDIEFGQKIGCGQFSLVYSGLLNIHNRKVEVALKVAKSRKFNFIYI